MQEKLPSKFFVYLFWLSIAFFFILVCIWTYKSFSTEKVDSIKCEDMGKIVKICFYEDGESDCYNLKYWSFVDFVIDNQIKPPLINPLPEPQK